MSTTEKTHVSAGTTKPKKENTVGVIARLRTSLSAKFPGTALDVNDTIASRHDLRAIIEAYEAERAYEDAEKEHHRAVQFWKGDAAETVKEAEARFVEAGERRRRAREALKA